MAIHKYKSKCDQCGKVRKSQIIMIPIEYNNGATRYRYMHFCFVCLAGILENLLGNIDYDIIRKWLKEIES